MTYARKKRKICVFGKFIVPLQPKNAISMALSKTKNGKEEKNKHSYLGKTSNLYIRGNYCIGIIVETACFFLSRR